MLHFSINGNNKLSIYPERCKIDCLDVIDLRDFCTIGVQYFEVLNNQEMPFDFKCRILATIWSSVSRKISLFFFSLIKEKSKEDLTIIGRMNLYLALTDIEYIGCIADRERNLYE